MKISPQSSICTLLLALIVFGSGRVLAVSSPRVKRARASALLGGAAAGGAHRRRRVGHPGAGAAIGGVLGLRNRALVRGPIAEEQENKQKEQRQSIDQRRAEVEKNRALIEELKKETSRRKKRAAASRSIYPMLRTLNLTART